MKTSLKDPLTFKPSIFAHIFKFVFPFFLWAVLLRDVFQKKAVIVEDTFGIYAVVKYYLDNLLNGVFASWNPYSLWGMGHVHQIGECNPFWFLIPLLNGLGCDYYHAFLWTISLYLFAGLIGFYLLARLILRDSCLAYWAFLLLMFSSLGMTLFVQLTFILIFVPAVWSCFFLVHWLQTWKRSSFLGWIFTLIIIVTTYIPFYFLAVFLIFVAGGMMLYAREMPPLWKGMCRFFQRNKIFVFACLCVFLLSLWIPVTTYLFFQNGVTAQVRDTSLTFTDVKDSGIPVMEFLRDFSVFSLFFYVSTPEVLSSIRDFSAFDNFDYYNQRIFFLAALAHIFLFVSFFQRIKKRTLLFLGYTLFIFFFSIANTFPLYAFFFRYVFFFKLFRNIFYFLPFLISVYILWALLQLKDLFSSYEGALRRKRGISLWVLSIHMLYFAFLWIKGALFGAEGLTVLGSLVLFVLYGMGAFRQRKTVLCVLGSFLIILQASGVFSRYMKRASLVQSDIVQESSRVNRARPVFSYQRPAFRKENYQVLNEHEIYQQFYRYLIEQKDSPGYFSSVYGYPTLWTRVLYRKMGERLRPYIRNKFIVYDSVEEVSEPDVDFQRLAERLTLLQNTATVINPESGETRPGSVPLNTAEPRAQMIHAGQEGFDVLVFDSDQIVIRTKFPGEKFLVYNDSFHPWWRAYINQERVRLYRSNYAFKGVWLPAGENVVRFQFSPPLGQAGFFIVLSVCTGLGGVFLWFLFRDYKQRIPDPGK